MMKCDERARAALLEPQMNAAWLQHPCFSPVKQKKNKKKNELVENFFEHFHERNLSVPLDLKLLDGGIKVRGEELLRGERKFLNHTGGAVNFSLFPFL